MDSESSITFLSVFVTSTDRIITFFKGVLRNTNHDERHIAEKRHTVHYHLQDRASHRRDRICVMKEKKLVVISVKHISKQSYQREPSVCTTFA